MIVDACGEDSVAAKYMPNSAVYQRYLAARKPGGRWGDADKKNFHTDGQPYYARKTPVSQAEKTPVITVSLGALMVFWVRRIAGRGVYGAATTATTLKDSGVWVWLPRDDEGWEHGVWFPREWEGFDPRAVREIVVLRWVQHARRHAEGTGFNLDGESFAKVVWK